MHKESHSDAIEFASMLKIHGIQSTPQRRAIWEYYSASTRGITMLEAINALKEEGIGQATVYRTTFMFLDIGLLQRIQMRDGRVCFVALNAQHSHPLICQICQDVVEFDACDLSVLEKLLVAQTGYQIAGHQLEVYGVCPKCQETSPAR